MSNKICIMREWPRQCNTSIRQMTYTLRHFFNCLFLSTKEKTKTKNKTKTKLVRLSSKSNPRKSLLNCISCTIMRLLHLFSINLIDNTSAEKPTKLSYPINRPLWWISCVSCFCKDETRIEESIKIKTESIKQEIAYCIPFRHAVASACTAECDMPQAQDPVWPIVHYLAYDFQL